MTELLCGSRAAEPLRIRENEEWLRPRAARGSAAEPRLRNDDLLPTDKLSFEFRFPVFEQKLYDLAEICRKLIERFALSVGTRKARYVADEQAGIRAFLNDGRELTHCLDFEGSQ